MGDPVHGPPQPPLPSKKVLKNLSLGVDLKLNLDLDLSNSTKKILQDMIQDSSSGSKSPPSMNFKDLPKPVQGPLQNLIVRKLNEIRMNYRPSIQPGLGVPVGAALNKALKATIKFDPKIPDQFMLYVNAEGGNPGAGIGLKLEGWGTLFEIGVHYLPRGAGWDHPGLVQ